MWLTDAVFSTILETKELYLVITEMETNKVNKVCSFSRIITIDFQPLILIKHRLEQNNTFFFRTSKLISGHNQYCLNKEKGLKNSLFKKRNRKNIVICVDTLYFFTPFNINNTGSLDNPYIKKIIHIWCWFYISWHYGILKIRGYLSLHKR